MVNASPYQIFNFTWQIINEAGDVANCSSFMGPSPKFDPLEVDLCRLAMGAHDSWGLSTQFLPLEVALQGYHQAGTAGCLDPGQRRLLNDVPIYVCPGISHRNRSLVIKCGLSTDF